MAVEGLFIVLFVLAASAMPRRGLRAASFSRHYLSLKCLLGRIFQGTNIKEKSALLGSKFLPNLSTSSRIAWVFFLSPVDRLLNETEGSLSSRLTISFDCLSVSPPPPHLRHLKVCSMSLLHPFFNPSVANSSSSSSLGSGAAVSSTDPTSVKVFFAEVKGKV